MNDAVLIEPEITIIKGLKIVDPDKSLTEQIKEVEQQIQSRQERRSEAHDFMTNFDTVHDNAMDALELAQDAPLTG